MPDKKPDSRHLPYSNILSPNIKKKFVSIKKCNRSYHCSVQRLKKSWRYKRIQLSEPKLGKKKNGDLRPALTSKDISDEIKITKAKLPLIYQQFFVCKYKCYPSGTWAIYSRSIWIVNIIPGDKFMIQWNPINTDTKGTCHVFCWVDP